jgi:hypothetical protein
MSFGLGPVWLSLLFERLVVRSNAYPRICRVSLALRVRRSALPAPRDIGCLDTALHCAVAASVPEILEGMRARFTKITAALDVGLARVVRSIDQNSQMPACQAEEGQDDDGGRSRDRPRSADVYPCAGRPRPVIYSSVVSRRFGAGPAEWVIIETVGVVTAHPRRVAPASTLARPS